MDDDALSQARAALGARLKDECRRLGLSAEQAAEAGGVSRATQFTYQGGTAAPDADYLLRLADAGFDVGYVLTGRRDHITVSPCARRLLDQYDVLPAQLQSIVENVAALASFARDANSDELARAMRRMDDAPHRVMHVHDPAPTFGRKKR